MGKAKRAHGCPATPFNRVICVVRWARRQRRRHPNEFGLPLPILRGRGLSARLDVLDRRMDKAERAHRCPATPLNRMCSWRSMGTAPRVSPRQWIRLAFAHPTWSRSSARVGVFDRRMGKAERAHHCPKIPQHRSLAGLPGKPKKPPAQPGAFLRTKSQIRYQPPNFSMYPPMKTTRMIRGRMYFT